MQPQQTPITFSFRSLVPCIKKITLQWPIGLSIDVGQNPNRLCTITAVFLFDFFCYQTASN